MGGYEPVDHEKEAYIQETLSAELDDAISKVAKMRKCEPPKCRSRARSIAKNEIHYYSRVCVKADSVMTEETIERFPCNTETANLNAIPDLNIWSKDVTDCLAERKELMKTLLQFQENERLQNIPGKRKRKDFIRPMSSHLYNLDFVVDDEKCVS